MKTTEISLPAQFVSLCEKHSVTPEHVIQQFIRDLCGLDGSSGSDERLYAQLYYERCCYALMAGVDSVVPERLDGPANTLASMVGVSRPGR